MSVIRLASSWRQSPKNAPGVFIAVVIVLALYFGRPLLIPIALAILLAILLNPVVRGLQHWGVGRVVSVLIAVSSAGLVLVGIGIVGSQQISRLAMTLPENSAKIVAKLRTLKSFGSGPVASHFEQMIEDISDELKPQPMNGSDDASNENVERLVLASEPTPWLKFLGPLGSVVEILATLAFTLVLLVFFLTDREGLTDRLVLLLGRSQLTLTSKALDDATSRVSRYIVMVAVINGGFGVILTAGLMALGVHFAVLWGCVAALLRFLPYIGPWIGAIFPITISVATSDGWWQPLSVFAFVMTLELITNNVVEPIVFGRTTGVAPTALLISAAFWLYLWGPVGLILSAPFALSLVVIGKHFPQLRFLEVLLGDQPALSADVSFYQRMIAGDHLQARILVGNRLREPDGEHVFDELLIPALAHTKRDFRRRYLSRQEVDEMLKNIRLSIVVAADQATAAESDDQSLRSKLQMPILFGCAADGSIDRVAVEMLQSMLAAAEWNLTIAADQTLTSELVESIKAAQPAAVCIVSVAPDGIARARYLCSKMRSGGITLPIVVGRWGQQRIKDADREQLMEAGATDITLTALDTSRWFKVRHSILSRTTLVKEDVA